MHAGKVVTGWFFSPGVLSRRHALRYADYPGARYANVQWGRPPRLFRPFVTRGRSKVGQVGRRGAHTQVNFLGIEDIVLSPDWI